MYFINFRCYPINTVLADPHQLDQKLRDYYNIISGSQCNSDDESSSDNDSLSDSDSESSDDSDVRTLNFQFLNSDSIFEVLKSASTVRDHIRI